MFGPPRLTVLAGLEILITRVTWQTHNGNLNCLLTSIFLWFLRGNTENKISIISQKISGFDLTKLLTVWNKKGNITPTLEQPEPTIISDLYEHFS